MFMGFGSSLPSHFNMVNKLQKQALDMIEGFLKGSC